MALEELGARGTDLAEMDQVSYFKLRRREKEEKWVKIPFCASLTWQTGAFLQRISAGQDKMMIYKNCH